MADELHKAIRSLHTELAERDRRVDKKLDEIIASQNTAAVNAARTESAVGNQSAGCKEFKRSTIGPLVIKVDNNSRAINKAYGAIGLVTLLFTAVAAYDVLSKAVGP